MFNKGNNLTNNNNINTSNLNINNNSSTSNNANISSNTVNGQTTDRIEWSRATILDFIEDYRRQRVLWDPNTKGYHIKQTKYEALKLLGHKYGAEIRSIRSKIKSLRSSFHREHGKVLNGRRKGLNYQPMWFAYDAIRFILDGESGDSDEADTQKNDSKTRETALFDASNNNNSNNNMCITSIDEELLEERKISSRDIEHFSNHFLALGLQARNPMVVIAAVEAAAAASAKERLQEQKYALKQQEIDTATQLKLLELSKNATISTAESTDTTTTNSNSLNLSSTSATFNPISKPLNSPKPSSPLATITSVPVTTTILSNINTTTTTPPPQPQLPPPSTTSTCSLESLSVLHGSRSVDENAASALASATAIPSLSITAVARNSDFDSSEYISADDVKTEIFESDTADLAMLEGTRTFTPVPLNYHKNATDLTINKSNMSHDNSNNSSKIPINGGSRLVGSRKRKAQMHSNVNQKQDAPSPSKSHHKQQQMQLQHSNVLHSRQNNYFNTNINCSNNVNNKQNSPDNADNDDDRNGDNDDDDETVEGDYSKPFAQLQTAFINSNNANTNSNNLTTCNSSKTVNAPPIDEYGVFGEYVAITIRKLKTSKAKIVVKHLINNLLYEAEMGKYDQGISASKEPPELYKM